MERRVLAAGSPAARISARVCMIAALVSLLLSSAAAVESAVWNTTNLDAWVYPNLPSAGGRALASTFSGGLSFNAQTNQFAPKAAGDPARVGMALVVFKTDPTVTSITPATPNLSPHRYRVKSVTLKATVERAGTGDLLYETAPVTNAQMVGEFNGTLSPTGRPFELYGVGFRGGYTGFGFGPSSPGPPLLEELSNYFTGGASIPYPLATDVNNCCGYADVTNSLTGGYSETAPGNFTAPFDPAPWAIGETNLAIGDEITDGTEFTFTIDEADLKSAPLRQYIQTGLAKGHLGFLLSSWNLTTVMGGNGAYPNWYMKEYGISPPTLEIQYDIVDPVAGDYDDDGDVDGQDFLLWQCSYGTTVHQGVGADGSKNSQVDGPDLSIWSTAFGTPGAAPAVTAVPEPNAPSIGAILVVAASVLRLIRRWPLPIHGV